MTIDLDDRIRALVGELVGAAPPAPELPAPAPARRRGVAVKVAAVTSVVAAGIIFAIFAIHPGSQVVSVPGAQVPGCAPAASNEDSVTVYNQPSIQVRWLPPGYHLVSGSPTDLYSVVPLMYQAKFGMNFPWMTVSVDVGITAANPPLSQLYPHAAVVNVAGHQGYVNARPGTTLLVWNPQSEIRIEMQGQGVAAGTLEQVADSIIAQLGPPTVISATSYLGPVSPLSKVLLVPSNRGEAQQLYSAGSVTTKLAVYVDLASALGSQEYSLNPSGDGTPVWLLYNTDTNSSTAKGGYVIFNARTGVLIVARTRAGGNLSRFDNVADHQNAHPCIQPTTSPTAR